MDRDEHDDDLGDLSHELRDLRALPETTDHPHRTRNTTGLLSMVAVLAMVIVWWLFSGNGPNGPDGNDPRFLPPDVDASGDAGTDGPLPVAVEDGLRIESYREDGSRLLLRLRLEPGDCPTLTTPRVSESDVAVTVTATHEVEDCRPVEDRRTARLTVALDAPLGDRAVLDGALAQRVRVEPRPAG